MRTMILTIAATLAIVGIIQAQCVYQVVDSFQNPSFEGTPTTHNPPSGWNSCFNTTPDTQPGSWSVTLQASDGNTYLGLTHDSSPNWQEGVSQQLTDSLHANEQYRFMLDIALSSSTSGGLSPCAAECLVWGGFSDCAYTSLLWESDTIIAYDNWYTYTADFVPNASYSHVSIQVRSLDSLNIPHLLIDKLSPIYRCVTATDVNFLSTSNLTYNLTPNPASTQLTISISEQQSGSTLTLTDLTGRVVLKSEIQNLKSEINIAELPSGIYLATLTTPGGQRAVRKVVKE